MRWLVIALLLLSAGCVQSHGFMVEDGRASWPAVTPVESEFSLIKQGEGFTTYRVVFENLGTDVAGLYVEPGEIKAGAVVIPGALVRKEQVSDLYSLLAREGIACLVLDVRGTGETPGGETEAESIKAFSAGKPSEPHKVVWDIIAAERILRDRLGGKQVIIAGESNGGRFGIIAASQTGGGVLVISTAGYGMGQPYDERTSFYKSIDPDTYASAVSRLTMVQPKSDPAIPLYNAKRTFSVCKGEKRFWEVDADIHGFNPVMEEEVIEAVEFLLG